MPIPPRSYNNIILPHGKLRAVIVSVDFGDLLALTLPYNRHHFEEVMVITTPGDTLTQKVAWANRALVYATDLFYKSGARFAKFAALERALDAFGRYGWLALIDADILWPHVLPSTALMPNKIYSLRRRRLLFKITVPVPPEHEWVGLPIDPQSTNPLSGECMGFTQVFHASDNHLPLPPWHDTTLTTAALGDSYFQSYWPLYNRVWLDCDCLHLGEYAINWCGRVTPYIDGSIPRDADKLRAEAERLKDSLWPVDLYK